jgi:hypothetical protein
MAMSEKKSDDGRLACMHVAEVHLDERNLHREHGVPQRDARVRQACRVEQDERDVARWRLVDAPDQFGFRITLERRQPVAELGGQLREAFVDLLERDWP